MSCEVVSGLSQNRSNKCRCGSCFWLSKTFGIIICLFAGVCLGFYNGFMQIYKYPCFKTSHVFKQLKVQALQVSANYLRIINHMLAVLFCKIFLLVIVLSPFHPSLFEKHRNKRCFQSISITETDIIRITKA